MIHELKTWPEYYRAVEDGSKTFEVRKADRDFAIGDTLKLKEWDPATGQYTGEELAKTVSYILYGNAFGVIGGYVVMGLAATLQE